MLQLLHGVGSTDATPLLRQTNLKKKTLANGELFFVPFDLFTFEIDVKKKKGKNRFHLLVHTFVKKFWPARRTLLPSTIF